MSRNWTLLLNRFFNLSVKGIFILVQLSYHLLKALTIEYISNILFVFDDALLWGLIVST
jgi:hypothetical protein